jgi:drug/metabolite transporter (DMT)-like permease
LGCGLVSGAYNAEIWKLNPIGVLVGLLSGILFSVYSITGKKFTGRDIDSWTTLFYTFCVAAAFLLLFNFLSLLKFPLGWAELGDTGLRLGRQIMWLGKSTSGWAVLLLLAAGPTVGGYGLYTLSLHYLSASTANLIAALEPPLTTIQAYLFLDERLSLPQILGSIFTLVGVVLIRNDD